jgi:hypothetical protein
MGRFSSVQSFADNHNAVRKVPYEQVSAAVVSTSTGSDGGVVSSSQQGTPGTTTTVKFIPPEKVVNPYGSTAGAGSGDFHVYRHSRNNELQRQKFMELSAKDQQLEIEYQNQLQQNQLWEIERTKKRQKKRERQKNAKRRKQNLIKAGISIHNNHGVLADDDDQSDDDENDNDDHEFQYTPGDALVESSVGVPVPSNIESKDDTDAATNSNTTQITSITNKPTEISIEEIPNDGSFLDTMKKILEQQQSQPDSKKNGS